MHSLFKFFINLTFYFCRLKKIIANISYLFFWIVFFIITKGMFLIYHYKLTAPLTATEIMKVFFYGLRMDLSFASYLSILPFLLVFISSIFKKLKVRLIVKWYTNILILILSFLTVADMELYKY